MSRLIFRRTGQAIMGLMADAIRDKHWNKLAQIIQGPWKNLGYYQPQAKLLQTALNEVMLTYRRLRDDAGRVVAFSHSDNDGGADADGHAGDDDEDSDDVDTVEEEATRDGEPKRHKGCQGFGRKAVACLLRNQMAMARAVVKGAAGAGLKVDAAALPAIVNAHFQPPRPGESRPPAPVIKV